MRVDRVWGGKKASETNIPIISNARHDHLICDSAERAELEGSHAPQRDDASRRQPRTQNCDARFELAEPRCNYIFICPSGNR